MSEVLIWELDVDGGEYGTVYFDALVDRNYEGSGIILNTGEVGVYGTDVALADDVTVFDLLFPVVNAEGLDDYDDIDFVTTNTVVVFTGEAGPLKQFFGKHFPGSRLTRAMSGNNDSDDDETLYFSGFIPKSDGDGSGLLDGLFGTGTRQTGDASNLILYIVLAAVCAAVIVFIVRRKKKKLSESEKA